MKIRSFKHNYHDGHLSRYTLGPRRELTLEVVLDPVWNKEAITVRIRLGGIENYDEVSSFLRTLPKPQREDAYIAALGGVAYWGERPNRVAIVFDVHGSLVVRSKNVSES